MSTGGDGLAGIQEYYGKHLRTRADLKTEACCSPDGLPARLRTIAAQLAPEVCERFYGCGSPVPLALEGCTVLDLGCGTGRDVYIASKLVGPQGRIIGVDMTEEQLQVARRHASFHRQQFGHPRSNVTFHQGFIEDLASVGVADESVDVVISNCVINLSPRKERVFSEAFRALKPGGELLFSDVFADRRLPGEWREDPVLVGECLAGAMYVEDFRRMLLRLGIPDYRIVTQRPIAVMNREIKAKVGNARFRSMTVRAFKIESLEDRCEDYGQVARYLGTIPDAGHSFVLDDHHEFAAGKWTPVCANTAAMLARTRLAPHFELEGDRSTHFGLFECEPSAGTSPDGAARADGSCC